MNDSIAASPTPDAQAETSPAEIEPSKAAQAPANPVTILPAYLALFTAIGAGCFTLSSSLSLSGIASYLWYALFVNLLISFGLQGGNGPVRKFCAWARVLSALFLPIFTLVGYSTFVNPLDAEAAVNEMVAIFVGFVTVMSILTIGSSFSNHTVPISAPLVPALSFFGLLNSLSVNTVTQVCFIVFAGATIYLISYERMLSRLKRLDSSETKPTLRQRALDTGRIATAYLIASSVWYGLFLAASAVLYYPMQTVLPSLIGDQFNRARRLGSSSKDDWRGSKSFVELRGGYITLSENVIMNVNMKGVPPSLWRGRVYDKYGGSRWDVIEKNASSVNLLDFQDAKIEIPKSAARTPFPPISSDLVRPGDLVNFRVEPGDTVFKNLFFPGVARAAHMDQLTQRISQIAVDEDGVLTLPSYVGVVWPYDLATQIPEENPAALLTAPGLTPSALKQWRQDPATRASLDVLPDQSRPREKVRAIAADILQKASASGRPLVTPYEKAIAVRDFLHAGYTYSLASPLVPFSEDAVVFFLTDSRQGACDMFASSAALLLRAMDVPTRLATGYLAAEAGMPDASGNTGTGRAGSERFPLKERDAHAWIEYYVPRAGWLTMDPTEGTRTNEVPLQAQIAQLFRFPTLNIPVQALLLPVAGLTLVLLGMFWPKLSRRLALSGSGVSSDLDRLRISEAYARALKLLKRRVPHRAHYTPQEYEAAVATAKLPLAAQQEFAALTYLSVAARYATKPPSIAQDELERCLRRLRQGLK